MKYAQPLINAIPAVNAPLYEEQIIEESQKRLQGVILPDGMSIDDFRVVIYQELILDGYFVTKDGRVYSEWIESAKGADGKYCSMRDVKLNLKTLVAVLNEHRTIVRKLRFTVRIPVNALNYQYWQNKNCAKTISAKVDVHRAVMRSWRPWHTYVLPYLTLEQVQMLAMQGTIINHIDQDATDNRVEKLEYTTQVENSRDSSAKKHDHALHERRRVNQAKWLPKNTKVKPKKPKNTLKKFFA